MVGTPFGSAEFIASFLHLRILEERRLLDALPAIRDPQCTWLITRLCAEPRANNILRTLADTEVMTSKILITTTSFCSAPFAHSFNSGGACARNTCCWLHFFVVTAVSACARLAPQCLLSGLGFSPSNLARPLSGLGRSRRRVSRTRRR